MIITKGLGSGLNIVTKGLGPWGEWLRDTLDTIGRIISATRITPPRIIGDAFNRRDL